MERLSFTLNGKKRNIRKKDFYALAENLDIPKKSAERLIIKVCQRSEEQDRQTVSIFTRDDR